MNCLPKKPPVTIAQKIMKASARGVASDTYPATVSIDENRDICMRFEDGSTLHRKDGA